MIETTRQKSGYRKLLVVLVKLFKLHEHCCASRLFSIYFIVEHTTFLDCLILVTHFALLLQILHSCLGLFH